MELGYALYFVVVFVFGGVVLLGLAAYFGWEVTCGNRPSWSNRTRASKVILMVSGLVFAWLLFIPLRMIWETRIDAIPGSYSSNGVWGTATLTMHSDGTFAEVWRFTNEYNGKSEGQGVTQGAWHNEGRDWLTRNIGLTSFKGLAEYDREHDPGAHGANVMAYGGITSIEIDSGSDIVFRK